MFPIWDGNKNSVNSHKNRNGHYYFVFLVFRMGFQREEKKEGAKKPREK